VTMVQMNNYWIFVNVNRPFIHSQSMFRRLDSIHIGPEWVGFHLRTETQSSIRKLVCQTRFRARDSSKDGRSCLYEPPNGSDDFERSGMKLYYSRGIYLEGVRKIMKISVMMAAVLASFRSYKNLRGLCPRANYTDRATAASRWS
jgi:hypothetical protein